MRRRILALTLCLLVQVGTVALIAAVHWHAPPGAFLQAEFSPGNAAPWEAVSLPHDWWSSGHRQLDSAWYRLRLAKPDLPAEPQAVLLWQTSARVRLYLNGMELNPGASRVPRSDYWPLYQTIPELRWRAGSNELAIQVFGQASGSGFLGPVYLGPDSVLREHYLWRVWLKVELIYIAAIIMLSVSLALALLGHWRGGDNVYSWLGRGGAAWSASAFVYTVPALSQSGALGQWLFVVLIVAFAISITIFMHRYLELSRPRLEGWLLRGGALAGLALALLGLAPASVFIGAQILIVAVAVGLFAYVVWQALRRYWQWPGSGGFWLMQATAVTFWLGLRDLAVFVGLLSPVQGLWADYVSPLMLITFSFIVLWRFHQALHEAENLNLALADRVREKEAQIQASYAALRLSEEQRTLAVERERILHDIHDGLGGTLVSALAGLDLQGEGESPAAGALRQALEDLRLMIYSLDQSDTTLRAALAMQRERLNRLGAEAGLSLGWNMQDLPRDLALQRGQTLQVLRVVQECFANTLKHARASRFALTIAPQQRAGRAGLHLELGDDGVGFDTNASPTEGYGLANLRTRARRIGAELQVTSCATGTLIALWLPVDEAGIATIT